MTGNNRGDPWKEARQRVSDGEFAAAGDYFTLAAYGAAAEGEITIPPLEVHQTDSAYSLKYYLQSALCYRRAGLAQRARNRGSQLILVAKDLRDSVVKYDAQRGLMEEIIGDVNVVLGDGPDEHYDRAFDYYSEFTEPLDKVKWQAEPEFGQVIDFFREACDAAGHDISREEKNKLTAEDLEYRITYKKAHFPDVVGSLVAESD